jgi:hypothetical protein
MRPDQATELADRIFLLALIVGLLIFAAATTQLGITARTVPVWVLVITGVTLVASLLEDLRARGKPEYRFQRPEPARKPLEGAPPQPFWVEALLFLSAPLLLYGLGFTFGGTAFILAYSFVKQRLSVARTGLLGAFACFVLAGMEWLYLNLVS